MFKLWISWSHNFQLVNKSGERSPGEHNTISWRWIKYMSFISEKYWKLLRPFPGVPLLSTATLNPSTRVFHFLLTYFTINFISGRHFVHNRWRSSQKIIPEFKSCVHGVHRQSGPNERFSRLLNWEIRFSRLQTLSNERSITRRLFGITNRCPL